jgi:hypothetical protein
MKKLTQKRLDESEEECAIYGSPRDDFALACESAGLTPEEEEAIVKFFHIIRKAENLKRASERLFQ